MDKKIILNVGTDFSLKQIEKYKELNQKYSEVKIGSVFGSLNSKELDVRSARPDYRIGNTTFSEFEKYVQMANDLNIEVEYTANATLYSSLDNLHGNLPKITENFKTLEKIGVKRLIVSNPLMMEIVHEYTGLKQKASTIMGINKPSAIKHYAKYGVDSICTDIYVNRNVPLLKELQTEALKYGAEIELLANEVCFYGDTPCSNVLRSACYQHSSFGGNYNKYFNNWPFSRCQSEREKYPVCWLKIPYILPQHTKIYQKNTGISRFKISGRTNSWEYLSSIVEKYLSQTFSGDIHNLFMLPQNTSSFTHKNITVEQLDNLSFFNKWTVEKKGCNYNCSTCGYCDKIYEKL
ncbi:MAG: hypothetical protein E7360_05075 [Clostridiales bacterium]|nr:hypothetical protein [Clostridiales bacterium]